jgi:hypothetical protein
MLTGGQVADCIARAKLFEQLPRCDILHGNDGYDSNAIQWQVADQGATAPAKSQSHMEELLLAFPLPQPKRHRALVLSAKGLRRVATRRDRNTVTFLGAVCIAANVSYWL